MTRIQRALHFLRTHDLQGIAGPENRAWAVVVTGRDNDFRVYLRRVISQKIMPAEVALGVINRHCVLLAARARRSVSADM